HQWSFALLDEVDPDAVGGHDTVAELAHDAQSPDAATAAPVGVTVRLGARPPTLTAMVATAATALAPLFTALLGDPLPVRVEFWDGSSLGPADAAARAVVRTPTALRRVLYAPNEVGLGRAYVTGELDLEGDVYDAMRTLNRVAP